MHCILFYKYNHSVGRASHTAWTPPSLPDIIVLLGGLGEGALTAENVPHIEAGIHPLSGAGNFTLEEHGHAGFACGIPDGDSIVLTGGCCSHTNVTRYNISGFVQKLPQLPEERSEHACASLPANGALVVAGGQRYGAPGSSFLTNTVLMLFPKATAWAHLASLPGKLYNPRVSIVGGRLRLSGGLGDSRGGSSPGSAQNEVLEYHPEPWNRWITVGYIERGRADHAILSVGPQQLSCLSECPLFPPSIGNLCAPPSGAQDCQFTDDFCCCGQCPENFTFSCVPDSMSGAGVWRSTLCPADGCGSNGVVTSPNYPSNYPNNLEKTETIYVEQGLILSMQFTAFSIELDYYTNHCRFDYLTITDGDGTTLMEKSCGGPSDRNTVYIGGQKIDSTLPPNIRSRTNVINIFFRTHHEHTRSGWSISWSAGMPGPGCIKTTACYDEDLDPKGENYDGCANTTVSGRTCQVGICFKILGLDSFATLIFRLGPLQPPTIMASHTSGMNPTTVAIQMGSLGHGMSCIRKLQSLNSEVLLA